MHLTLAQVGDERGIFVQRLAPEKNIPPAQVGDELLVHLGGFGEQGAQHSGAGYHQRSPRPPDMEGGDVAVADSLLLAHFRRELPQGERGFNKKAVRLRHSLCSPFRR